MHARAVLCGCLAALALATSAHADDQVSRHWIARIGTGLAAAIGLDMDLGSKWFANVDARWMDIDSSMSIGNTPRGTLKLDPYMFGLSIGRRRR